MSPKAAPPASSGRKAAPNCESRGWSGEVGGEPGGKVACVVQTAP